MRPTLKTVTAFRYLTPLREGGSLPAVVETNEGELYAMKFAGAGHGRKALIAELVAGEIGRALGLRVIELARPREEYVILDWGKRRAALGLIIPPVIVNIERRALVDEPQFVFPNEYVWVTRRAVHVRDVGVEPDDGGSEDGIGRWREQWIESKGLG